MKLIYYPDHDQRYAHIPERERREYPDEVHFMHRSPIKRVKKFKDLTREDLEGIAGYIHIGIAACDVPISRACVRD